MKNIYCYTDTTETISLETDYDTSLEKNIFQFKKSYPDLSQRLIQKDGSLFFLITDKRTLQERDWAVDFLESNINNGRHTNDEGVALPISLYKDLYDLFLDKNLKKVYFNTGNAFCTIGTIGKFDCNYYFSLCSDGLFWQDEETWENS